MASLHEALIVFLVVCKAVRPRTVGPLLERALHTKGIFEACPEVCRSPALPSSLGSLGRHLRIGNIFFETFWELRLPTEPGNIADISY